VRIFKNEAFMRFARKAGLDDAALSKAIQDAERSLIAADLGGARAVFVHGFAKDEKGNIGPDELAALKRLASELMAFDGKAIARALAYGTLIEVMCDEEAIP
jgi:hypothetical protein